MRLPPQAPVDLPEGVSHASHTAYNAPYKCRCEECQNFRRSYDRDRMELYRQSKAYRESRSTK